MKNLKEYTLKIPKTINLIYSKKKNILLLFNKNKIKRVLRIKIEIFLIKEFSILKIIGSEYKYYNRNKISAMSIINKIKKCLIELIYKQYTKLKIVGVGYKVLSIKIDNTNILKFKLGYSHDIFFKIPKNIQVICKKNNIMYIIGNNHKQMNQIIYKIRSFKKPDPYKGKGILYENQKIQLKSTFKKI